MSKICPVCGAELNDNATFCNKCGAKLGEATPQAETKQSTSPAQSATAAVQSVVDKVKTIDKKKLPVLIGVAAVAVVVVIVVIALICSALFGGGPQKALDNYATAVMHPSDKNIRKLFPEAYWESEFEDGVDEAIENMVESAESSLDDLKEDYGNNVKVTFKVNDQETVRDSVLKDVKDYMKDNYDIPKKDVKKMVRLDVTAKIKGSGDEEEEDITVYVAKIGGSWYTVTKDGRLTLPGIS